MKCSGFLRCLFVLLVLPACPLVLAGTATTTFTVTATINTACSVIANNLSFGIYNPIGGSSLAGTTTVLPTCTNTTPYTIALNAGNTGTFVNRLMVQGANSLQYNLYTTVGHTTVWGDGTGATVTVPGTGTGSQQSFTVFGLIPANQTTVPPSASAYSDTITVTVAF